MELQNLQQALIYAQRHLGVKKRGFHEGTHGKVAYWVAMPDGTLAVLSFKRDWLHTFSRLFPKWHGRGWGQTMNLNLLREAANRFALVIIIMPDGTIYSKAAKDWLYLANKYESIRQPSTEEELEASIPARELDRVYPQ